MYLDGLPLAKDRTKLYFAHSGAAFPETMFFWGLPNNNDFGWANPDKIMTNRFIRYHINGNLELTAMMLDEYSYTRDAATAKEYLVPIAEAVTTYFDQHFARGRAIFLPETTPSRDACSSSYGGDQGQARVACRSVGGCERRVHAAACTTGAVVTST